MCTYIHIILILKNIHLLIYLSKIHKYTYTYARWYTRTGNTHIYIYIISQVSTCCDSDRQTDTHAHATNSLNSHTALLQRGRSPMLARPRRSRTVKSSSRGHAQIHFQWMSTESVRECLCVCVCLYVYRSNMFEISYMYKCNVIYSLSLYSSRNIVRVSCWPFEISKELKFLIFFSLFNFVRNFYRCLDDFKRS